MSFIKIIKFYNFFRKKNFNKLFVEVRSSAIMSFSLEVW